nr:hypothetical protein [Kocuria rhizophila]
MTDYKPERGERAVFYGSAVGNIEVYVADYRGHFQDVGGLYPGDPTLVWRPYADHSATESRPLDADTQTWVWDTLCEAKRRHEAGEDLAPLATHRLVKNSTSYGMHLEPIETEEDEPCSALF